MTGVACSAHHGQEKEGESLKFEERTLLAGSLVGFARRLAGVGQPHPR